MDFLKRKIRPVEINIESVDKLSGYKIKINFKVIFQIEFFFNTRRLRFESKGMLETGETIDKQTLTKILEATEHDKFVDLNLRKRDKGNFDYQYLHKDNWLTINYTTF